MTLAIGRIVTILMTLVAKEKVCIVLIMRVSDRWQPLLHV
jgi:hypothetical protein